MIEVLFFTAPSWCGPCRVVGPVVDELKREGWNITVIDVDKERATAQKWNVMAMPTFIILKDDQQVRRFTGARSKAALLAELTSL